MVRFGKIVRRLIMVKKKIKKVVRKIEKSSGSPAKDANRKRLK
jgi:hypothetical protein